MSKISNAITLLMLLSTGRKYTQEELERYKKSINEIINKFSTNALRSAKERPSIHLSSVASAMRPNEERPRS